MRWNGLLKMKPPRRRKTSHDEPSAAPPLKFLGLAGRDQCGSLRADYAVNELSEPRAWNGSGET
jgi:hypothetical protein